MSGCSLSLKQYRAGSSAERHRPRGGARGLTLIELMVVVAVLAILATIAYPAYERMMQGVRRGDARTLAHAVALAEERFFTVNGRYAVTPASIFPSGGAFAGGLSEKGYYEIDDGAGKKLVAAGPTGDIATSFTVRVEPVAGTSQANDKNCTLLTLDSRGVQGGTAQSAETVKCW